MDGLINDIITITIDDPSWLNHVKNLALLVNHTIFRPLQSSEPLNRDEPLSLYKLAGEVKLAGSKTYLGWDIQNLSLQVFSPREK